MRFAGWGLRLSPDKRRKATDPVYQLGATPAFGRRLAPVSRSGAELEWPVIAVHTTRLDLDHSVFRLSNGRSATSSPALERPLCPAGRSGANDRPAVLRDYASHHAGAGTELGGEGNRTLGEVPEELSSLRAVQPRRDPAGSNLVGALLSVRNRVGQ